MLKAIVFDFDGVLVDSEPLHYKSLIIVGQKVGRSIDYPQYLRDYIAYADRDSFRLLLTGRVAPADDATEQRITQMIEDKRLLFAKLVADGAATIDGTWTLVDQLANTMPLAIASAASRADIELMLEQIGKRDRFDVIVSADDVTRSKPDPACYALAVQQLGERHRTLNLQPEQCLGIEDTPAGLEAARQAGLMTLGLATNAPADQLDLADRVVEDPGTLDAQTLRQWFDR